MQTKSELFAGLNLRKNWWQILFLTVIAILIIQQGHAIDDTPEKLDYTKMAIILEALMRAVSVIVEDVDGQGMAMNHRAEKSKSSSAAKE